MSGNQYLFLFTIGPVQSFIAQARKTRDLYAGSQILGEIIEAAMNYAYAQKEYGAEIIIPNPGSVAKPNRFVMTVTSESDDRVREFGENLEAVAKDMWIKFALDSLQGAEVCSFEKGVNVKDLDPPFCRDLLNKHEKGLKLPEGYRQQICGFLEVYWVGIKRTDSYAVDYNNIQKLLAAIKNTRQFNQIHESAARKCSLDGERNALFYRKATNNGKPAFIQREHENKDGAKEINGKKKYLMTPGEALSAVSLAKRFYEKEQGFPSTAEMALMNVLEKIDDSKKKEYKKPFGEYFDEQLYYEENLAANYFRKRGLDKLIGQFPILQDQRKALFEGHKQSRYYALIAFDGDDMGKVWSGEFLKDKSGLEEFQKKLAQCLGEFAEKAKEIVKAPKGETVYAGGDDFLGFVNLNSLFEVMKDLRVAYEKLVYEPLASSDKFLIEKPLTFSAGVTIAHYKEPLGEVLRYVRQAEHDAKDIDEDKDAFSLVVLKGSGEIDKIRYKWYLGDSECFTKVLQEVVRQLLDEKNGFTNTFIKNIDREFRPLMDKKGFYPDGDQMLRRELLRLLTRSAVNKETVKSSVANFNAFVLRLYDNDYCMENFFSGLHICDFLKRELKNNASS